MLGRAVRGEQQPDGGSAERLGEGRLRHRLFDGSGGFRLRIDEAEGDDGAAVHLRSIELLQYLEADAVPQRRIVNRFLVLHVIAENCSNTTLESLSAGMSRPRVKLKVQDPGAEELAGEGWISPLQHFADKAIDALRGSTDLPCERIALSPGGFLVSDAAPGSTERLAEKKELMRLSLPPLRIAMAIPAVTVDGEPGVLPPTPGSSWSREERWAWLLATGADRYVEAVPDQTRERAELARCGAYRTWTIWASEFGLSLVRHWLVGPEPLRIGETKFIRYAQTHYVDLAVLVMRGYQALGVLSAELARIDRDVERQVMQALLPADGEQNADDLAQDLSRERLRLQVQKLEEIQADFAVFRDRLWFNGVPRHQVDTQILLTLRERCGVDRLYEDFVDELELRRQVYSTQHTARSLEDARRQELERRREEERRGHERDRREEQRAQSALRSERLNQWLAVAAIVFAVPAIVESFGLWDSALAGAVVLILMLVLGATAFWGVARLNRHDPEPPRADTAERG